MKAQHDRQVTAAGQLVEMSPDQRCRALVRFYVTCPELLCQTHADRQRHLQVLDLFQQAGRTPPWRDSELIQRAMDRHNFHAPETRPYLEALLEAAEQRG